MKTGNKFSPVERQVWENPKLQRIAARQKEVNAIYRRHIRLGYSSKDARLAAQSLLGK